MGTSELIIRHIKNYLKTFRERPADGAAFTFLFCVSIMTYLFGTFEVLPKLLIGLPSFVMWFCVVITTWMITAVLSNLLLSGRRNSTIATRMLLRPTMKTSSVTTNKVNSTQDDIIREQTKSIGQHFMPEPFGHDGNWHICATCEVFVPPRAWHCFQCKTCVLRRDHHCIFTMCCIGEENHSNFLGLLLYLAMGSTMATAVNLIYVILFSNHPLWLFVLKAFIPFYTLIFDFSLMNVLFGINFLGMFCTWVIFANYLLMATRNQTSADKSRNVARVTLGKSKYTYSNLEKFLGNNPALRLLWPFHSPLKIQYGSSEPQETRKVL